MATKSFAVQNVVRASRLLSFCVGMFCAVTVSAQSTATSNQPPGVTALEWRWEKHTSNGMKYSQPTPTPVGEVNEGVPDRPLVSWPYGRIGSRPIFW